MNDWFNDPMGQPKLAYNSFKSLFTNSPTAMLVEGGDGGVRDVNDSACTLLGAKRAEIIGRQASELIPDTDLPLSTNPETGPRTGSLNPKGGTPLQVSLHSAPIENELGQATLISIWPTSSTESEIPSSPAQEDPTQENDFNSVHHASAHIANFISDSLTPIQGFVSLAQADLKQGHIRSAHLQQIAKAANRGAAFARELFKFSRQPPDRVEIIAPGTLLNELEFELKKCAGDSVTILFNTSKETPEIRIARSDFRTIMLHVIRNATAGADGGRQIKINCTPETNNPPHPPSSSTPFAVICVTDDGAAIEKNISKHAFDPFFSLPGRNDPHGLCLPTVKQLMKNYGGNARLASSAEEGTTLTLLFPAARH